MLMSSLSAAYINAAAKEQLSVATEQVGLGQRCIRSQHAAAGGKISSVRHV